MDEEERNALDERVSLHKEDVHEAPDNSGKEAEDSPAAPSVPKNPEETINPEKDIPVNGIDNQKTSDEPVSPVNQEMQIGPIPPVNNGIQGRPIPPVNQGMTNPPIPPVNNGMPYQSAPPVNNGMPYQSAPPVNNGMPYQSVPPVNNGMPYQSAPPVNNGMPYQSVPPVNNGMPYQSAPPVGVLNHQIPPAGYGIPNHQIPPSQIYGNNQSGYGYRDGGETAQKGMAIASMVLGIVGIVLCAWFYIGIPCAIVGLVLGCIYRSKGGRNGMATAGIICSSIGLGLAVLEVCFFIMNLGYWMLY